VKIRGFRIELGEIDATLTDHPHVSHAATIVREDQPGDRRLVSYIVPTPNTHPHPTTLRTHTTTRLPDYMVPTHVIVLDQLPLNANGKLDRAALPAPVGPSGSDGGRPPRT